ncbi:Drug/Metabolite Transporter (DMT) Superfamily [Achlya hypogyna]|uniref:Drug/Metabolite Transporter (DMT) Superfamily n=1 Tax=Achlya hypogyna TaxID=1202772 RepID=A0A1V9YD81_ACHHY|nr:Drug/Metabolite Transporter (DMT) Superfamily [Achlya hypogyna]
MKTEASPLVVHEVAPPHHLLGLSLVAASAFTFSLMSCAVKFESDSMSSFWRSLISWILTLATILGQGSSLTVAKKFWWYLALRCVVGFVSMTLGFWTMTQMALADATVIIFTSPIIAALLGAVVLHEKADGFSLACAILAFGGVVCVSRPTFLFGAQEEAVTNGSKLAFLGGLGAAITQAVAHVAVRKLQRLHFLIVTHYFFLTSLVLSAVWIATTQDGFVWAMPVSAWVVAVSTGVFGYLGHLFLTKGFQLENVGIASVMRYLDIVFVFIWEATLLQEPINPWSVVGALVICGCAMGISEEARLVPPVARPPHHLLGLSLVAASAFMFSLMSCAVKFESGTMTSMESVFWRSLFSWLLTLATILVRGSRLTVTKEFWGYLALRCVVGFISMALGFWTMTQMALADASVIIFTSPVLAALLGVVLLHEKIDRFSLACAILSFGGVVCVSRPTFLFGAQDEAVTNGSKLAVLGGLGSASAQAMVYVAVRKLQRLDFLVVIHYFFLTSLLLSTIWITTIEEGFVWAMPPSTWAVAVSTGVLGYLGQLFMTKGFQLENVGIASVMRYLDIVFVFIWEVTLLHEPINPWSIVGALIICGCAIGIAVRKSHLK